MFNDALVIILVDYLLPPPRRRPVVVGRGDGTVEKVIPLMGLDVGLAGDDAPRELLLLLFLFLLVLAFLGRTRFGWRWLRRGVAVST